MTSEDMVPASLAGRRMSDRTAVLVLILWTLATSAIFALIAGWVCR